MPESSNFDIVVIGGGPAGLTATIYALRKRLNVLLITKDLGGKTNYRLQLPDIEHHLVINGEEVVNRFVNEIEYLDFAREMEAVEQGIARKPITHDEEYRQAAAIIRRSRNLTQNMMEEGFIAKAEE